MDLYTYFVNWRKAYHSARTTYHQTMFAFYDHQIEAMEIWPKMMLEAYKAMIGAFTIRNLFAKPNMDIDFFKKWI